MEMHSIDNMSGIVLARFCPAPVSQFFRDAKSFLTRRAHELFGHQLLDLRPLQYGYLHTDSLKDTFSCTLGETGES